MEIKRDGLFFKFLSLYDSNTYRLDSCKVLKLIIRNCWLSFVFFVLGPFIGLSILGVFLYYPFVLASDGFILAGVIASMIIYSLPFIGWHLATREEYTTENKGPSVVAQLYDSWKNKYCIKVEVV